MPIYKIQAGRIITVTADEYVAPAGTLFYDETLGNVRIGDGETPGGRPIDRSVIQSETAPAPSTSTIWYNLLDQTLYIYDQTQWIPVAGGGGGVGGGGITIIGSVANSTLLDPSYAGATGDGFIAEDTSDLWVWNGSTWINAGRIQGPVGFTGSAGYTGSQGEAGYTGSAGYIGSQGDLGYTGSRGPIGYTGSAGYIGSQGADGYTGSQGDSGFTGSQGADGYTGSQGDLGYTGSQGDSGYTGSQGADGYTGSQGDSGFTGSQGDLGYTGSQGDLGYTGSQGDLGYTGSAGQDGIIGYNGSDGYTGSQGDLGYTGSQGDLGYTGSAGQDGIIGYNGSDGYTGSQGYTGSAGPGADQDLNTTSSVTFANLTLATAGVITFADGTIQRTKSPQMYTNADAEAGLTIDDMFPGDFYYDDTSESIFIMVDTGYGYNTLLDLTVRAA